MTTRRTVRTLIALTLLALCSAPMGACNTVQGIGRDISALGSALTGSSEHVQEETNLAGHSDEDY